MKLRCFDKISSLLSEGYYVVAIRHDHEIRDEHSFTFACGWNGTTAIDMLEVNTAEITWPEHFSNRSKRFGMSSASIHNSIKNVLSESIYDFIFNEYRCRNLEIIILEYHDRTCINLNQTIYICSKQEAQEFYKEHVV